MESTMQRNHFLEVKSLRSQIASLKQHLHFQQQEHETALAIKDVELKNIATRVEELRRV